MSTSKRRKLDQETASNGSTSRGTGRRAAAAAAASSTTANASSSSKTAGTQAAGNAKGSSLANGDGGAYVPVLALSSLPAPALARYALHYGLVPPEPLTPAQAIHPTPAIPSSLTLASSHLVPSRRRNSLIPDRSIGATAGPSSLLSPQFAERQPKEQQAKRKHQSRMQEDGKGAVNGKNGESTKASRVNGGNSMDEDGVHGPLPPKRMQAGSTSASSSGNSSSSGHDCKRSHLVAFEDPGEPEAEELRGFNAFEGGMDQFRERIGALARTHWERQNNVKEGETIINFAYAIRMRSKILKSCPPS